MCFPRRVEPDRVQRARLGCPRAVRCLVCRLRARAAHRAAVVPRPRAAGVRRAGRLAAGGRLRGGGGAPEQRRRRRRSQRDGDGGAVVGLALTARCALAICIGPVNVTSGPCPPPPPCGDNVTASPPPPPPPVDTSDCSSLVDLLPAEVCAVLPVRQREQERDCGEVLRAYPLHRPPPTAAELAAAAAAVAAAGAAAALLRLPAARPHPPLARAARRAAAAVRRQRHRRGVDVVATNGTAAALDAPCPPNETAKATEAAWTPSELRVSGSDVMESRPRPGTPMQRMHARASK